MDYNEQKYNAFYDELEKMGGWPAIAAIASRAIPAIASVGSKVLSKAPKLLGGKAGAGMAGASMLAGGAKKKSPGFFRSLMPRRPRPMGGPRF
jgi:hypothetical protein